LSEIWPGWLSLGSYNRGPCFSEPLKLACFRKPHPSLAGQTRKGAADREEVVAGAARGTRIHPTQLPGGFGDGQAEPVCADARKDRQRSRCSNQGTLRRLTIS